MPDIYTVTNNVHVMKKIWFLSVAVTLCSASLFAQHHYQAVLDTLQRHSVALAVMELHCADERCARMSAPLLDDPQVSFEHLWASRTGEGNRWGASVTQSFPLPGRYGSLRQVRRLEADTVEAHWLLRRQRELLEIQRICADVVYANMQLAHYDHCLLLAQQVVDAVSRRMEVGDCGIVDYNRARLELAALSNKRTMLLTLRDNKLHQLRILNGNRDVVLSDTRFPSVMLPSDFDQWYNGVAGDMLELRLADTQTQLQQARYKLIRREVLPMLTAGLAVEYEADCLFRGVTLGVTLPVWNRRKQVSSARLDWQTAQQDQRQMELALYGRLYMLYEQVGRLSDEVSQLSEQCAQFDSEALLVKAFMVGEMSLESYLRQVEFFHDTEQAVIDACYALECAWLELMSVTL